MVPIEYQVRVNEEQLNLMIVALEEYFRIRLNQWFDLADELAFEGFDDKEHTEEEFNARIGLRHQIEDLLKAVSNKRGRYNRSLPMSDDCRTISDMWRVLRHTRYMSRPGEKNPWCTDYAEPIQLGGQPAITVEVVR